MTLVDFLKNYKVPVITTLALVVLTVTTYQSTVLADENKQQSPEFVVAILFALLAVMTIVGVVALIDLDTTPLTGLGRKFYFGTAQVDGSKIRKVEWK